MMAYERSESARDNFGKFIHQFQPETKTLLRKLERIQIKLYRLNVSLLFNQTCLNERLTTHTHTHIYIGSSVSSTEKDIDTRLTKAWTTIDRLSIIWKSDLTDKMKHGFFQAAVVSIQLYGCTTWTLTKRLEKKLDGNYTRMLRAILNKSCGNTHKAPTIRPPASHHENYPS